MAEEKTFLKDSFKELNTDVHVALWIYRNEINKDGLKYVSSLKVPEPNGWVNEQNPYRWFWWYCGYFPGRKADNDERQIKR